MTLPVHARYDLAAETADVVRDLLDRWRERDTYFVQHPHERNRMAGTHGIFCHDLVAFLVAGRRIVLDATHRRPARQKGAETAASGPPGLLRHWPSLEIELGQVTVDGVVEWKSHTTQ